MSFNLIEFSPKDFEIKYLFISKALADISIGLFRSVCIIFSSAFFILNIVSKFFDIFWLWSVIVIVSTFDASEFIRDIFRVKFVTVSTTSIDVTRESFANAAASLADAWVSLSSRPFLIAPNKSLLDLACSADIVRIVCRSPLEMPTI